MKKTLIIIAIVIWAADASADALIYAGANTGYAESGSSSEFTYGFHVGTGIIPFFGIEAGYWDFGSFHGVDSSSIYLAAKPCIDIGPFHLFAKGGFTRFDQDGPGGSNDGIDLMYGLGAEYFISRTFTLGASYMNFGQDGDNIDTLTLGATFHFL